MPLYPHVNGREDRLEGMTDRLVARVRRANAGDAGPLDGWQAYLQRFAHAVRDIAIDHPLSADRHAPSGRPVAATAAAQRGRRRGLPRRADRAAFDRSSGRRRLPLNEGDAPVPTGDDGLDLASYPTVIRLRATLSVDHSSAEFEQGLEALLDRLDLHLSQ